MRNYKTLRYKSKFKLYKYEIKSMKCKIRNKLNLALFNNKNKNYPLMNYKQ